MALAFACLLAPSRGVLWTAGAPLAAAGCALLALRDPEPRRPIATLYPLLALLLLVVPALWAVRWNDLSLQRAAWLCAGVSLAAGVSVGALSRRAAAWVVLAVAAVSCAVASARSALGCELGEWAFSEVWESADIGALSPLIRSDPAGALAAIALPLAPWLARDEERRWARPAALAAGWLLLAALVHLHPAEAVLAAWAGVTALLLARRAWKRLAIAAVAGAVLAGVFFSLPAQRQSSLRKEALVRAGAWGEARAVLLSGALQPSPSPMPSTLGLGGYSSGYDQVRSRRASVFAGIERPATALCDPLQWFAETGPVGAAALVWVVGGAWVGSLRRRPYAHGALVAAAFGSCLGGVLVSPAAGWAALLVLALALPPVDAPESPDPGEDARRGDGRFVWAAPALLAVLLAGLALASPPWRGSVESTRPAALWSEAEAVDDDEAWRRAGQAFTLRWEALDRTAHADAERVRRERDLYRRFCLANAERLREADPGASRAYLSLADQLR